MTEHVLRAVVTVLPDERNRCLILMRESVRHDGSTVGANESSLGCVTTKVSSHFDCLLPFLELLLIQPAPTELACCYSATHRPWDRDVASIQ